MPCAADGKIIDFFDRAFVIHSATNVWDWSGKRTCGFTSTRSGHWSFSSRRLKLAHLHLKGRDRNQRRCPS
eukprot:9736590-Prorocentrum_lima.AAC.1